MARVAVWLSGCSAAHPLLAAPAAGRLRGGMGAFARMPRNLTRRGCPSAARQRVASSTAHPANAPLQVCPVATRRGRRLQGRLSFGYFSLAKQRTSTSPAGARPGPPPSAQAQAQAETEYAQLRINEAQQQIDAANANLNLVWNATTKEIRSQLLDSQKTWLKKRELECKLQGNNAEYGEEQITTLNCETEMTNSRVDQLKQAIYQLDANY